ncbi:MAG: hypothetical protein ABW184_08185 [Sphingobium sp.]
MFQSLDELLYEVVSWMIFYPVTLWRSLVHPFKMMNYADAELADTPEEQYTDALSPPVFLLLSLVLSHCLELLLVGESKLIRERAGLDGLIDSDTNLIVFRILMFSIFPLMMAARIVRKRHKRLDREAMRRPFYSQCYVAAPFALSLGVAGTLLQCHWDWARPVSGIMILVIFLWYGWLQTRWFSIHLGSSTAVGFGHASIAMIQALTITVTVGLLFA